MKKRNVLRPLLLLTIGSIFLFSCSAERSREDKVSTIISKVDSPFLVINAVPGDIIDKSGALDGALPFTQEMLLGFFIDESVTGVDYDTDVQIIVAKGPSFTPDIYGLFKLKNEEAFIELLETEANADVLEKDGFKYVIKESDRYVIVWNEEFAIASSIPLDLAAMLSGGGSNQGMKAVDANIGLIKAADEEDVNTDYKTFLDNKSDIAIHFEGKGFYAYLMEMSMGENEEIEAKRDVIEGVNTDIFFNFNNGSIDIQTLSDLSDKVKEEFSFLKEDGVNAKLLAQGNEADPVMTMVYNTDLSTALDYFKEQMSDSDYEDFEVEVEDMGLTVESARSALTGEIVVIMDRFEIIEREINWGYGESYTRREPMPFFAVVLGVQDKATLLTLMENDSTTEVTAGGLVKAGDAYLVLKDDFLFSTNDSSWAYKVQDGNGAKINDKGDVLSKKPFGLFVDFVTISEFDELEEAQAIVEQLSDFRASGNMDEMNFSLKFKDDSKNALRILTETISDLSDKGYEGEEYEALEAELEAASVDDNE